MNEKHAKKFNSAKVARLRRQSAPDPAPPSLVQAPTGYARWLADLKEAIASSRRRAVVAVHTELVTLYWRIGRDILERQAKYGCGGKEGGTTPKAHRSDKGVCQSRRLTFLS